MRVAHRLKRARNDAGLTVAALAERLSVTDRTVSNYEAGTREPDFATLAAIARATGRTAAWFLEGDEQEPELLEGYLQQAEELGVRREAAVRLLGTVLPAGAVGRAVAEWESRRGEDRRGGRVSPRAPVPDPADGGPLREDAGRHGPELGGPGPPAAPAGGSSGGVDLATIISHAVAQGVAQAVAPVVEELQALREESRATKEVIRKEASTTRKRLEMVDQALQRQGKFADGKFYHSRGAPSPEDAEAEGAR